MTLIRQQSVSRRCFPARQPQNLSRGLTMVELLVVITIIGMLVGIVLPALQSARESSRRISCKNRMKQVAIAALGFESRMGFFASFTGPDDTNPSRPHHNFIAFLLADLEQVALADRYSFEHEWFEALRPSPEIANLHLAETKLGILLCPSSPTPSESGTSDYAICVGLSSDSDGARQRLLSDGILIPRSNWQSMLAPIDLQTNRYRKIHAKHVGDGLSRSIMLCEDSARPDYYLAGGRNHDSGIDPVSGAMWADPEGEFSVNSLCHGALINCNNDNEVYSFHAGGANFAFGDGSIRFLVESIAPNTFVSLLTRNAGD